MSRSITVSNGNGKEKNNNTGEIWVINFDENSAAEFREKVLRQVYNNPAQPLIIYIDSFGGQIDSLAKMIETMDEVSARFGTAIITVCMGKAMSCGAILLSHGDIRYCGPHSRVMIHEASTGAVGCVHDVHNNSTESIRINEYFLGILAKNCGIKRGYPGLRSMIKKGDGREMWLNAEEALDFGIIDYIGTPALNQILQYDIQTTPMVDKKKIRKHFKKAIEASESE